MESPAPLSLLSVAPDAFRRWRGESELIDSIQVVFACGPHRTGTTWLTQNFQDHPNASSRCEGNLCPDLLAEVIPRIRAFSAGRPDHAWYCRITETDAAMLARQIIDRQLIHYIRSVKDHKSGPITAVIDKTPLNCFYIDDLATLYPHAKFICCTRDVRDAAVSFHFYQMRRPDHEQDIIVSVHQYVTRIYAPMIRAAREAAARLGAERYTETTYETRKSDPHGEVGRLLRFVGLDASPPVVARCVASGDFAKITGREPGDEARSHYRKAIVGDWRNHLTPEQGDELLAIAGRLIGDAAAAPARPHQRSLASESTETAVA